MAVAMSLLLGQHPAISSKGCLEADLYTNSPLGQAVKQSLYIVTKLKWL